MVSPVGSAQSIAEIAAAEVKAGDQFTQNFDPQSESEVSPSDFSLERSQGSGSGASVPPPDIDPRGNVLNIVA